MKKHVIIATGAALLSTSAFATKARMAALGQNEDRGSQYVQDSRNIFRNAAHVNNMNNYVVTEWGSGADAEGGFFRSTGNLSYGLYLGSQRDTGLRTFDATGATLDIDSPDAYQPGNQLDFFLAGDAGFQWGLRLNYQGGKDENPDSTVQNAEEKRNAFGLGLGVLMGDLSAYANVSLAAKSELSGADVTNNEIKGKLGLNLGAAYNWQNLTFHGDFATNKAERSVEGNDFTAEYKYTDITVGVAQTHEISSTAMVFMALDYSNTKWENSNLSVDGNEVPTDNSGLELKRNRLAATIGFETDATSWLTWRGSISQNIFLGSTEVALTPANDNVNGKKQVLKESTVVAAGASLTFGKLVVDGTIAGGSNGNLDLDTVMTNVAVSYWF